MCHPSQRIHPIAPVLALILVCGIASSADGATLEKVKLGGGGPIDRPTALTSWWCFSGWSCAVQDTFVADGDSATVRLQARNFDSIGGSPMSIRIDNFVVAERSVYDAAVQSIGPALLADYPCANGNPDRPALDFVPLLPGGVAYANRFAGAIGPEWTYDPAQILYEEGNCGASGAPMWDDPFDPQRDGANCPVTSTGHMLMGSGSGPEFVEAELQLTDLTPGAEYVVSYWWSSGAQDDIQLSQCTSPNDDFEIEIFGEQLICTPDPPAWSLAGFRTLAWDEATSIWRFQLVFRNTGAGVARELGITLEDASAGVEILESFSPIGSAFPGTRTSYYSGSFEIDLSGFPLFTGRGPLLYFLFEYRDDCGGSVSEGIDFQASPPDAYPTSAPSAAPGMVLRQNVPNPFNPRTAIEFKLERRGHVELTIHDQRGRLVRRLLDEERGFGAHEIVWDGRDEQLRTVAAGTYFYRLRSSGQQSVRRMVLVK